jgi:hypothetical protein
MILERRQDSEGTEQGEQMSASSNILWLKQITTTYVFSVDIYITHTI